MMQQQRPRMGLPVVVILTAIAAALGFGASHWLNARTSLVAAPTTVASMASTAKPAAENAAVEVKIPTEYLSAAQIAVEPVGEGGLKAEILVAGTVMAPLNGEAAIVARVSGNVTRVSGQLGDTIRAGEMLVQVESLEAAAMTADRSVAAAKADLARKSYVRESSLFAQGVTSRQDMEAAQSALLVAESEAQRASSVAQAAHVTADGKSVTVVSPINGKITSQMVTLGGFVQPQTELFRVAGTGQVLVEVSLPAADMGRVAPGDKATIVAASGMPVEATVRSVTPTVSGSARAATVVLVPASLAKGLIVGEGVQARLHVKTVATGMVVPEDAVQNLDDHDVLFVRTKEGFLAQPVLVGTRSGGVAQIVSGVSAGTKVATQNAFLIKADMIKSAKGE